MSLILLISIVFVLNGCDEESSPSKNEVEVQLQNQVNKNEELTQQMDLLKMENEELRRINRELEEEINQIREEKEEQKNSQLEEAGLVNLMDIDPSIIIDLKYATKDNFVHEVVYPVEIALLQKEVAMKLKKANEIAKKDGYFIKVWDAYRPLDVQKIFWELVSNHQYVADPSKGSNHNRGTAIDVTLVDKGGQELEMPSDFDDFSERASRKFDGSSIKAKENMQYLTRIMKESGFTTINSEWWHFNDVNANNYPILNIPFQ